MIIVKINILSKKVNDQNVNLDILIYFASSTSSSGTDGDDDEFAFVFGVWDGTDAQEEDILLLVPTFHAGFPSSLSKLYGYMFMW